MSQIPEYVLPGQPIFPIYTPTASAISVKYIAGTNVRLDSIQFKKSVIPSLISTTLGRVSIIDSIAEANTKVVSVISKNDPEFNESDKGISSRRFKAITPNVGDIVLGKIVRISSNRINVEILSVTADNYVEEENEEKKVIASKHEKKDFMQLTNLISTENGEHFKAIIRSQDVRSTERDSVKTWECYQPGDIVRALVVSLGDGVNYYLTTARNDLGVVFARNSEGESMYALDWETMIVPSTGEIEKRKCAKPF